MTCKPSSTNLLLSYLGDTEAERRRFSGRHMNERKLRGDVLPRKLARNMLVPI